MFELLQRLFIGHNHKWVIKEAHRVKQESGDYEKTTGIITVAQCEKCGRLKTYRIDA